MCVQCTTVSSTSHHHYSMLITIIESVNKRREYLLIIRSNCRVSYTCVHAKDVNRYQYNVLIQKNPLLFFYFRPVFDVDHLKLNRYLKMQQDLSTLSDTLNRLLFVLYCE